ncbi:putative baseplate assembly protein [Nostoc sp. UHCC 0702]|nr:putative baseplate assembly protein [Nostoc sp. UHCC 0702]
MSETTNLPELDPCGCCEVDFPLPTVYNRPGLFSLVYRVGTHPTFVRRMLNRIWSVEIPDGPHAKTRPLAILTTRSTSDPAIAIIDAWAVVADVLSFYQERIANEGYLRTATERFSVLQLARTIGYELRPGVSAQAYLAFTVEDAFGSPGVTTIPQGTKVQSLPGQGQLPQTFESSAEIIGRAEWNSLRPRQTRPQELAIVNQKLYLLAISTDFGEGIGEDLAVDQIYPLDANIELPNAGVVPGLEIKQIYLTGTTSNVKVGDLLLLVGKKGDNGIQTLPLSVQRLEVELGLNRTRIDLEKEEVQQTPQPVSFRPRIYKIAPLVLSYIPFTQTQVNQNIRARTWRDRDLTAFISIQRDWSRRRLIKYINTTPPPPPPSQLPPTDPGVFRFGEKLGIFGNNAPLYKSLPESLRSVSADNTNDTDKAYPYNWDDGGWEIWKDSLTNENYTNADLYLERSLSGLVSNTWVVLERPVNLYQAYRVRNVSDTSLAGFALSSKATGVQLAEENGSSPINKPSDLKVRTTTAYVQSERLGIAEILIETPLTPGSTSLQLNRMVIGLLVGQSLILTGELTELPGITASEVVILTDIQHSGGYTQLFFQKEGLKNSYIRKTVTLNANVVSATHGETVTEILGSGNGNQANQRFTLKKPPLTYISATTASGSQSTLQLRVNGILWQEAPSLYGLNSSSENYIIRREDDGSTQVIFGDSIMGSRLPTGAENVIANYRSGIGLVGMVGADKLTLLQTIPLGIRSVTNPLPSSGAADPESRSSARSNAPLTVLTLDRIVSLQDFEDFARAFAGVGKAQAIAFWQGEKPIVHITVAATAAIAINDDQELTPSLASHVIDAESDLFKNLVAAIQNACDPAHQFVVKSYQPLFFNLKAEVLINPRYQPAKVLAVVETQLKTAFAFEQRAFGQQVTAAEIITVIQQVAGVIAVKIKQLYRYQEGEIPPTADVQITPEVLNVERVKQLGDLAQLLLINPVGITLEAMQP